MAQPKKSSVGLIVGIIGGVLAILAVVAFFVFGNPGDKEKEETADAGDKAAAVEVGGLNLDLTPADATVKVDGKEYPGASPRVITGLEAGTHKLEVSKGESFMAFTQDVQVTGGQTLSLPLKLQARDVTLTIKAEPAAAKIEILAGDKATEVGKGQAAYKHALKRADGVEYKLKATAEGYGESVVPISFTGDANQDLSITLVKEGGGEDDGKAEADSGKKVSKKTKKRRTPKPKNAELKIGVAPGNPPATVYVDGRKQSKKTPVFVKVSAGSHTVKWKWSDGKTDTQRVKVGAHDSKLLKGSK